MNSTEPTAADVEALAKWLCTTHPMSPFWADVDAEGKESWQYLAHALLTNPPAVLVAAVKRKEKTNGN